MYIAPMDTNLPDPDTLPRQSASQVKNKWGEVVRLVRQKGSVAISSHSTVEMVLLDASTYRTLRSEIQALEAREQSRLGELARRFDARLASLQAVDAATNAEKLFEARGKFNQRPKAGDSF